MTIKRLTFAPGPGPVSSAAFGWALEAPPEARPIRSVICTALPELVDCPAHPAVGIEWFADPDHADRYSAWLESAGGAPDAEAAVIVAEEHVLRGGPWLDRRWAEGRPQLKHMAIARRAHDLSPAEFSDCWQNRAGRVGATPIPDIAKGCAYAQNHPLSRPDIDWRYDAVNEVWFDDEEALRSRIAWMDEALSGGDDDDFISESSFLAVREAVVISGA